jgi:hypothetical protein
MKFDPTPKPLMDTLDTHKPADNVVVGTDWQAQTVNKELVQELRHKLEIAETRNAELESRLRDYETGFLP